MTPAAGRALSAFTADFQPRIEAALRELLPPKTTAPAALHEAMHYALFPGGKRLRPVLALVACQAVGADPAQALMAAAGIECLHTYSLVHDDLPCMDDDALRRGRPTCHTVYGEATALLAGDALLTVAFAGVATAGTGAVLRLAQAAGSLGMVGGQMADLEAEGGQGARDLERVAWIHDRKTGALMTAAVVIGALAGAGSQPLPAPLLHQLERFGDCLGRAFQIADDCLDLTGSAADLGKNPLVDVSRDKLTWPAVAGLDKSLVTARDLAAEAGALAAGITAAAADWRGLPGRDLDGATALLQDLAVAAVDRRR